MAPSSTSLRFVDEVVDLTTVFDAGVNVVALRRAAPKPLLEEGVRAAGEVGFRRLFMTESSAAEHNVSAELQGWPHLAADTRFWVEVLSELTGATHVGVRLTRIEEAMCPRFHVDGVTVRLVTTYVGLGSEFVSSEQVDRTRLGHAASGMTDATSGLLRTSDCVRSAQAFDVVLLKGEAWPGNKGRGAVHRSPAASAAAPRLVLTLDAL